jgi:hypothetical protein
MDDKRYAAAMELIASGLGAIGAAEIHRTYKDIEKLQKKTKNGGMLKAFMKDHPCPLCGTKKASPLTPGRERSKKNRPTLDRPQDGPSDA